MPSKAFLASSDARRTRATRRRWASHVGGVTVDMPFIAARKRELVKEFADYRIEGIDEFPLYTGAAHFLSPTELHVGDEYDARAEQVRHRDRQRRSARRCCPGLTRPDTSIATRCSSWRRIPDSVDRAGRRLHGLRARAVSLADGREDDDADSQRSSADPTDDDVGEALTGYFREEGIEVVTRTTLLEARRGADGVRSCATRSTAREREVVAEEIFFALGRMPNVDGPRSRSRAASRYDPVERHRGRRDDAHEQSEHLRGRRRDRRVHARPRCDLSGRGRGAQRLSRRAREGRLLAGGGVIRSSAIRRSRRSVRAKRICSADGIPVRQRPVRLRRARQSAVSW